MKIKVSEATGAALDWMVAKCEGKTKLYQIKAGHQRIIDTGHPEYAEAYKRSHNCYSTDPAQAWPIIERENISMIKRPKSEDSVWAADNFADPTIPQHLEFGPTALIAAMRCYVVSRLGEEVEVPDEL